MLSKSDSNKEEEMKQQKGDSEDETEIEMEAAVQEVCSATGCSVSIGCLLMLHVQNSLIHEGNP